MKKLSVLYLVPALDYGGSETLLLAFLKFLDKTKFHPEIHCFYSNGKLVKEFRENGITVHEWHAPRREDPITFFRMLFHLRHKKYDIVHTHLFDWQGRIAAFLAGIPVIITTYHLVSDWDFTGNFINWVKIHLDSLTSKLNDKIIVVSEEVGENAVLKGKISAEKIVTVLNGIDVDSFCTTCDEENLRTDLGLEGKRVIIAVGRLEEQKGHIHLIKAARILKKDFPDINIIIVGEGPLLDVLKSKIEEYKLEDTVKLLGPRRDISELLSLADVYAMPSLFEGLPIALLEAMAAAKPIVATRVDGIQSVLRSGIEGLLVPPKDEKSLAEAISVLLSDPQLAASHAESSRKKVEEDFSIVNHVRRIEEIYIDQASKKGLIA
jgi:glycosyltransferase involved in cell wall biosynthesis